MKRRIVAFGAALCVFAFSSPALAAKKRGPGKPTPARAAEACKDLSGDQLEACKVVGAYLDLWKQKKWADLKKLIHPKTTEAIASVKEALKMERHAMAPWFWAQEIYLLTDWKVETVTDGAMGTVIFETVEDTYRIEEDGIEKDSRASYLVGKSGGKWYVTDRRAGGGGFDETAITIGKKGYFDEPKGSAKAD